MGLWENQQNLPQQFIRKNINREKFFKNLNDGYFEALRFSHPGCPQKHGQGQKHFPPRVGDVVLRGHSKKIFKTRAHLNIRRNFFSWRVVDKWNSLTEEEVSAQSTASFKNKYDKQEVIRQGRMP